MKMKVSYGSHRAFLVKVVGLALMLATSALPAFAADDLYTVWTGKGDGRSWSDANNWRGVRMSPGVKPTDSDWQDGVKPSDAYHNFIVIDTDVEGFKGVLTNDISKIDYVDSFQITGTRSITIVSDYRFGFRTGNTKGLNVTTTGEVTLDCRIEIYNYPYLMFEGPSRVNFLKDVYVDGRWRMNDGTTPATAEMHFYGKVTGPSTEFKGKDSNYGYMEMTYGAGNVYFHQPVEMAHMRKMGGIYKSTWFHFLAPGNRVGCLALSGYSRTYCDCANAFGAEQVMEFYPWYLENLCCPYVFGTHDQVFDRIQSDETVAADGFRTTCVFGRESDMTLTLKGSADATTYAKAMGNTTIVWDSAGKHTQAFLRAPHDTTGDLIVLSGKVLLDKNTTFLKVPRVVLGANGVIELGAEQTVSPFAGNTAELVVEAGGKLVIPAGKSVTFKHVKTSDGTVWGAGTTYTSANADWIDGEGTVTCTENVTSWATATSGLWSDATKWTGASPEASARANVTAVGAPYTVSVASDVTLENVALDVAGPAKVSVGAGASFTYRGAPAALEADGPVFALRDGATFETFGQTFWTNFTGNIEISSDDTSVTSKLTIAGGMLTLFSADREKYKLCVGKGGAVEVKNGAVLHPIDFTWQGSSFGLFGGRLTFSDTAEFRQGGSWQTIFGSGEVVFEDNSVYTAGYYGEDPRGDGYQGYTRPYFAPLEPGLENAARLTFKDHARYAGNGSNSFYVDGSYCGKRGFSPNEDLLNGYSFVTFASDADHVAGYMNVGKDEGTAEVRLEAGSLTLKPWDAGLDIALNNTTGRVYVTGGTLDISGGSGFKGITVGECTPDGTKKALGEFYLTTGSVSHERGLHAIGCGAAVGRYVQTGGTFDEKTAGVSDSLVVGLAGGDGLFAVSNGTYRSFSWAWIGGSTRTEHQKDAAYANYHDAVGKLVVSAADPSQACQVYVNEGLFVGQDGMGEIEIGRASKVSDFLLKSNQSLQLLNGAQSTLRYTFAEDGVGLIQLGNDFNVSAGSKLIIDASRYAGRSRRFPLVNAKTRTGSFADGDITLLVPEGYSGEILQFEPSGSGVETVLQLHLRRNVGTVITIR